MTAPANDLQVSVALLRLWLEAGLITLAFYLAELRRRGLGSAA
jgi:hypothetical protein